MGLGMSVRTDAGQLPSPLRELDLRYPANLGIATSGLGTAFCTRNNLEEDGPAGCPRNSIMGRGSALARFRIGPEIFRESASIGIVAGPSPDGGQHLLVSATGLAPVAARIVMESSLENGHLQISVPLVPSLPEGEDVAVIDVNATIGGRLRYTERRHGRLVSFIPKGIGLPSSCPKGGFRFSGRFTFEDGTRASASTVVPCPRGRREPIGASSGVDTESDHIARATEGGRPYSAQGRGSRVVRLRDGPPLGFGDQLGERRGLEDGPAQFALATQGRTLRG
jgi:hypothetical protein